MCLNYNSVIVCLYIHIFADTFVEAMGGHVSANIANVRVCVRENTPKLLCSGFFAAWLRRVPRASLPPYRTIVVDLSNREKERDIQRKCVHERDNFPASRCVKLRIYLESY